MKKPLHKISIAPIIFIISMSIITSCKTEDEVVTEFACGTEMVTFHGQQYNTVQIGDQCWLKENLNVGTRIDLNKNQADNGTIEKYCYDNLPEKCNTYGGLYQWDEMMQYTTTPGVQGICPPDWHLPTDEEWKVLEGRVDSKYGIGHPVWDNEGSRGYDAGTKLKTNSLWYENGNGTDLFGFSGLPGGTGGEYGSSSGIGYSGLWWTSTEYNAYSAWYHSLHYENPGVIRSSGFYKWSGFSVRCLRDK